MKQFFITLIFTIGICLGSFAGHFHGKAETLDKLVGKNIECILSMDSMTEDMLK